MKASSILSLVWLCLPVAAQPDGQINTTISPSTGIRIGQTVTVTCRMSDYHGTAEIDSVNFKVRYDPSRFAFVNGSFNTGTGSGSDQQWLSKTPQESAAEGYALTNRSHGSVPGYVCIMMGDLGLTGVERGTRATDGFLISFQLQAISPGTAALTLQPGSDGSVLLDTSFRPVATIGLSAPPPIVTANPASIFIEAVDPAGSEPGIDTPSFLFRRIGPGNAPVTVRFNVGGTARPAWDYRYLESSLLIPAGVSEALLVVEIYDDSEIEGDETVTLTLSPSADYDISGTGTATVIIHDDENPPPTVVLTSPAGATIFPESASITLIASASDANGAITNVEFYRDGTVKLGEDTSSPYTFTWTNVPPGNYVLTARAIDNFGATADSVPVSIVVQGPPSIAIVSPADGASIGASSTIHVSARANDPDGAIIFLELYRNGAVFAATNGGALDSVWSNTIVGTYTLTARACDEQGLLGTSAPVVVTVTPSGLADNFADRIALPGLTNFATGNTASFTHETGETNHHAGRNGVRSAWFTMVPSLTGLCTLDTEGSAFDTVLAVYTNNPPAVVTLTNLGMVAYNDDSSGNVVWSKLAFTAVAGSAYQIVADGYGPASSGNLIFHMRLSNSVPVITASPQSQVVNVGDTTNFTVSAMGSGSLLYQWRKNGTNLAGATASTLTRTNVQLTDGGSYQVVVSSSGGSVASAPAVLVVRAAPDFTLLPSTQVINAGGTATFSAGTTGSAPLTYQWNFNGVPLPGAVTNTITRYNAQHGDGGLYQVTVANAAGSTKAGAELIVRPLFTSLTPSNDTLYFTWHGTTGKVYVVEGTAALAPSSVGWTTLGRVTNTALQGQFQISLTNLPRSMIRLRLEP